MSDVTSGALWRKPREQGVLITLPSGNKCRIRPVGVDVFIKLTKIPDSLTPIIVRMVEGRADPDELAGAMIQEGVIKNLDLINTFVRCCLVSPRVVDDPQAEDEISIEDIDLTDRTFIMGFLNAPAVALESFRLEQENPVEPVGAEPVDGPTAEPDPEPQGMGSQPVAGPEQLLGGVAA